MQSIVNISVEQNNSTDFFFFKDAPPNTPYVFASFGNLKVLK